MTHGQTLFLILNKKARSRNYGSWQVGRVTEKLGTEPQSQTPISSL